MVKPLVGYSSLQTSGTEVLGVLWKCMNSEVCHLRVCNWFK